MKSKRTVFAVIVMVLCLIAAAMVIIGFVNNWQNETIIDFIIKTIGKLLFQVRKINLILKIVQWKY